MTSSQKMKTTFRSSAKWKKFRSWIKKERRVDAVTGKPLLKGFNVHHCDLNEQHYTDISNPDNFECLNRTSHKVIHWLYRYSNWRDVLFNIGRILEKMEKINE